MWNFVKGVITVQSQSKVQRVEGRVASSLESPHSRNFTRDCTRTHSAASVCTYTSKRSVCVYIHAARGLAIGLFTLTQRHARRHITSNVVINNKSVFFFKL